MCKVALGFRSLSALEISEQFQGPRIVFVVQLYSAIGRHNILLAFTRIPAPGSTTDSP